MSKRLFKMLLALTLVAAMLMGLCLTALADDMPPAMPGDMGGMPPEMGGMPGGMMMGGGDVPPPPPDGGSRTFYYAEDQDGFIQTELADGTYTDAVFPDFAQADTFGNAVRARDYRSVTLNNAAIFKTAGAKGGDDSSFYGVNSGLLVCDHATVGMNDGFVLTDASGANGIFAYGYANTALDNVTVVTNQNGSGGIMVAGGGTLTAQNCNVWTEGGSSAAIRSDRGSGIMTIDGGTYVSNGSLGTGSPAIYCVADITVSDSILIARNAQAMCFEGRNPGKLYNCYLEGNYTASDDDEASNVMVYQSMSGDAAEGTSYFTMVDGVLADKCALSNAKMFYTTNTYCYISLANVEMRYANETEPFLLCACNTNMRGWGKAGANGSECGLCCIDQDVKGDIIYDTFSFPSCFFTQGTNVESTIYAREDNGTRGCDVYMDASSVWTLTGDSLVRDLYTGGASIVGADGKAVAIKAADGTVYAQGDSAFTLTVTGTYSVEDHSAQSYMPQIGTATEYSFDPEALRAEYVNAAFDPAAVDADACVKPEVQFTTAKTLEEAFVPGLNSSPVVVPTNQALSVNGIALPVAPAAYNCDGYNYFKIRDLAMLLSATSAKFNVSYDEAQNAVVVELGKDYVPVGGELAAVGEPTKVLVSPQSFLLNGAPVAPDAYNIDGNNYFKLADLGAILGFEVGYDEATRTILVNTGDADFTMPQIIVSDPLAEPAPAPAEPAPAPAPAEPAPAPVAGGTDDAAYKAYLKAFVASCEDITASGAAEEFYAAIDAGNFTEKPCVMLFEEAPFGGGWFGEKAMTYDEFVAAGGVYVIGDHASNGGRLDDQPDAAPAM